MKNPLSYITNFFSKETEAEQTNVTNSVNYDSDLYWNPVSYLTSHFDSIHNLDKYRSYVYACVNKKAINIAKADRYIYREFKSKKTEIKDHPLLSVMRNGNIYDQSFEQILYLVVANLEIYGNAYLHVVMTELGNAKIINEFRCLPAKYVKPVYNKDNTLIERYDYGDLSFKKDQIIHFKIPDLNNNLIGKSPVSAFNFTLDIDYLQNRFSRKMFDNNANLEGVMLTNEGGISSDQRDKLETQFNAKYTGVDKNGKTAILPPAIKDYKTIQATPKELDFSESRIAIRDEIFVIMDIPKTIMNVSDDVNYNNAKSALRTFIENTLLPYAQIHIESQFNIFFRKIYGSKFLFLFDYSFQDRELQLKEQEFYAKYEVVDMSVIRELNDFDETAAPKEKDEIPEDEKQPINQK